MTYVSISLITRRENLSHVTNCQMTSHLLHEFSKRVEPQKKIHIHIPALCEYFNTFSVDCLFLQTARKRIHFTYFALTSKTR